MTAKITDEELLQLLERYHHADGQPNTTQIAEATGMARSSIQSRFGRLARNGKLLHLGAAMPGFEVVKRVTKTEDGFVTEKVDHSEDALVLPEGHILKKTSLKIGDSWYKTELSNSALTREAITEMFEDYRGKSEILTAPRGCDPNRLAFYPTADLHIGMLAWGKDSQMAWDLNIAERAYMDAFTELVHCTPATQTAILLDVGDQFHMNDQTNATPAHGHRLDVDGRFPKVAKAGIKLRRRMIELALQKHEKVIYRGVRGNHDPEAQMWLSIALSMFFENNPRVEIDIDPGDFWFYEFGKTALFANHGHKIKPFDLPGIMAADYPEAWGRTPFKYAFSGHTHNEKSGTKLGVIWEVLRPGTPGDNHSWTSGYRGGHEFTSICFSSETGRGVRQYSPV